MMLFTNLCTWGPMTFLSKRKQPPQPPSSYANAGWLVLFLAIDGVITSPPMARHLDLTLTTARVNRDYTATSDWVPPPHRCLKTTIGRGSPQRNPSCLSFLERLEAYCSGLGVSWFVNRQRYLVLRWHVWLEACSPLYSDVYNVHPIMFYSYSLFYWVLLLLERVQF